MAAHAQGDTFPGGLSAESDTPVLSWITNVSVLAALGRELGKCIPPSWVWETSALPNVKSFQILC